jgi:hypothetical protein
VMQAFLAAAAALISRRGMTSSNSSGMLLDDMFISLPKSKASAPLQLQAQG